MFNYVFHIFTTVKVQFFCSNDYLQTIIIIQLRNWIAFYGNDIISFLMRFFPSITRSWDFKANLVELIMKSVFFLSKKKTRRKFWVQNLFRHFFFLSPFFQSLFFVARIFTLQTFFSFLSHRGSVTYYKLL